MDTWIHRMVRSRCVRRLGAIAAALACVALLGYGQERYIQNFVMGPYAFGQQQLDAIGDVADAPRYFVRVSGSEALDTGIQQISIEKRKGVETKRSVTAAYYALVVGQKLLVCKSGSGSRTTFEGELAAMPPDLPPHLFGTPDMQAIRDRFYPFYLSDESFRLPGYFGLAGLLVVGLVAVRKGGPAWRLLQDPAAHPVVERVTRWGDPIGVAVAAEKASRAPRYKSNGWLLSDQFLIQSTFFGFELLRVSDLLWGYKKVTKHSVNFIPTGKTYEAVLVCYGGAASFQGKEKQVDQILGFAAGRAPWAIFGYSAELQQAFDKDGPAFAAAVEDRKREWARQAGAKPAS